MKVSELIELLKSEDPERIVILSRDCEGNGYSPLYNVETAAYKDAEIGLESINDLTPDIRELGYCEDDILVGGQPAIVFWPEG